MFDLIPKGGRFNEPCVQSNIGILLLFSQDTQILTYGMASPKHFHRKQQKYSKILLSAKQKIKIVQKRQQI